MHATVLYFLESQVILWSDRYTGILGGTARWTSGFKRVRPMANLETHNGDVATSQSRLRFTLTPQRIFVDTIHDWNRTFLPQPLLISGKRHSPSRLRQISSDLPLTPIDALNLSGFVVDFQFNNVPHSLRTAFGVWSCPSHRGVNY